MPGTVIFKPIQANLTHNTEWVGKMDPYCLYRLGDQEIKGQVCKKGGKEPHWEDAVTIPLTDQTICVVDLKDKDILIDDKIGTFEIDLHEVESQGRLKKWYPIFYKEKPAGEILMEAIFSNETPIGTKTSNEPIPTHMNPTYTSSTHTISTHTNPLTTSLTTSTYTYTIPSYTNPISTMPTVLTSQPIFQPVTQPDNSELYAQESLMRGVDPLNTNVTSQYNNQPIGGMMPGFEQPTNTTYIASNIGTHGTHTHSDHYPNQQLPFGHGHHMPNDDKNPMKDDEEFMGEGLPRKY
jgi:hypothetical protein